MSTKETEGCVFHTMLVPQLVVNISTSHYVGKGCVSPVAARIG